MIIGKTCTEPTLWDETLLELGAHPLQLWGWGELKAAHNWSAHRVLFTDETGETHGAAQILVRPLPGPFKRFDYVPRGPVARKGSEAEVLDALATYCQKHLAGTLLTVEPDSELFLGGAAWKKSPNTVLIPRTLILDLSISSDELLSRMTKKTRQYIRKSEREGVTIKRVKTRSDIAPLLDIYRQTADRAKFALHDDEYYYDVHDKLGDCSIIFAAYVDNQPVAFVWLAASSSIAFELYGGMNDIGQTLRANYFLKWHAISTCKEWGIARYDMNGLLNDGVSTFKQGFSDSETMLAGTFDHPLSRLYTAWTRGLPLAKKAIRKVKTLR